MFSLRPYQQTLTDDVRNAYRTSRRVLMVLPTGAGKTVIFAYITQSAAAKGNRITIVAHRVEIVEQISRALDEMGVRHGRIQPGHVPTDDPVQVAMIQTLARRSAKHQPPDLIVVDECHHATSASYDTILKLWPDAKILGVTATPERLDGKGLGRAFDEMVVGVSPAELIEQGFLAPFRYLAPPTKIDLAGVKTEYGDYKQDQLASAVDKAIITGDAVAHYRQHIAPRPAIVFCVRVDDAEHVAAQFVDGGFRAASVDGRMGASERRRHIEGIGNGSLDVLTSCALIGEGLDVPSVGGVILLRPTQSLAMHLQQIGRALRPKSDGSSAVILDHVGNVHRHGLPDQERAWTLEDRKRKVGGQDITVCDACSQVFATGPGWLKEARAATNDGCLGVERPDCALHVRAVAAVDGAEVAVRDGVLTEFVRPDAPPAEWSRGISLTTNGRDFDRLVALANTRERLEEVRVARGYKAGWVHRIMVSRIGRRNAA